MVVIAKSLTPSAVNRRIQAEARWQRVKVLINEYGYGLSDAFRLADDKPAGVADNYDDAIARAEEDRAEAYRYGSY
ncbi:hypothetical protein FAES_4062 [Fibrella aestuarina BUZ 2]|uniref:Uncharacterized protein n=1 Tax=Fibrella aestuarina BUZ 2 TaxID=1166018 RepID=I0KD59_9BACT|nr:hypothetical protein [Fibrella aestuarina]CCH02062.1 hypothetical protein FAES_4062 [Fibrella aestuarina BUZ 2]